MAAAATLTVGWLARVPTSSAAASPGPEPTGRPLPLTGVVDGFVAWWQLSGSLPLTFLALLAVLCLGPGPALGVVRTAADGSPMLPGVPGYLAATTPLGVVVDAARLLRTALPVPGRVRPADPPASR